MPLEYRGHTRRAPQLEHEKPEYGCCEHCIHWQTTKQHDHPTACSYIVNLQQIEKTGEKAQRCQTQRPRLVIARAGYRWRIHTDHIAEANGNESDAPSNTNAKGMEGPSNADPELTTNPARFSLWDDDDNCYYEGMIYGDFDGFEPLDDYGTPNAGCSYVKINGEIL